VQLEQGIQFTVGPVYVGREERRIPFSLNKRLHWGARHRWNKAWKESVEAGIWENKRKFGKLPIRYARISVTLSSIRLLDIDNAFTAVKPIVDALTEYGVIEDDCPDLIQLVVLQQKVAHRNDEKVTLRIERIEDVFRSTRNNNQGSTENLPPECGAEDFDAILV
jgi:Holliday junction resolvase RusA-like endonuclease